MSHPHALIIDDDANNLEVLAGLLAGQGISNTAVLDPTKVPAELEKNRSEIDVVFCDLEMPKVSGYDLLPYLKEQLGKKVPIITYTVHLSEMDTARRMGFDGFLGKPINADEFPAHIKRILSGQAVWELP